MTELNEEEPATGEKLERSDLLTVTSSLIRRLDKKAGTARLQEESIEKMRDSKARLLIEAIKTHGSLLRDETLESIEARLQALEERVK